MCRPDRGYDYGSAGSFRGWEEINRLHRVDMHDEPGVPIACRFWPIRSCSVRFVEMVSFNSSVWIAGSLSSPSRSMRRLLDPHPSKGQHGSMSTRSRTRYRLNTKHRYPSQIGRYDRSQFRVPADLTVNSWNPLANSDRGAHIEYHDGLGAHQKLPGHVTCAGDFRAYEHAVLETVILLTYAVAYGRPDWSLISSAIQQFRSIEMVLE